ncbi:unnamed protein product [Mesocestoides corti]|uniref:RRM domain-containing protein n=1 Tax=Mesocestoides corti TaxID=53468 RepID=A0A0R3UA06_MESCO|nr:unnamed protein product [Mesocestoides corti]
MNNPAFDRPPPTGIYYGAPKPPSLCVSNFPDGMTESDLYPFFPTATHISCQANGSSTSCLIQFRSDADCQAAFTECQNGKLVGGRPVQARIAPTGGPESNSGGYPRAGGYPASNAPRRGGSDYYGNGGSSAPRDYGSNYFPQDSNCILTLHNLAWSVTEDDLVREFPRAINASVKLDEHNRSRGWGTVTFANTNDCRNAEADCANKSINGRPVRAEIGYASDRYRDDGYRGGRGSGGGRFYGDRGNGGGGRRGGYGNDGGGMHQRRRFDDTDGGGERRSWGGGGGPRRGGGGGPGGAGGGRGGFDRDRRDRSPGRRKSGGPGARITSAVIRRAPGDSSDSDFDNRR